MALYPQPGMVPVGSLAKARVFRKLWTPLFCSLFDLYSLTGELLFWVSAASVLTRVLSLSPASFPPQQSLMLVHDHNLGVPIKLLSIHWVYKWQDRPCLAGYKVRHFIQHAKKMTGRLAVAGQRDRC